VTTLAIAHVAEPLQQHAPATAKADRIAQALLLAVLFAAPALMCLHAANMNDTDIWWHLRTGEWILQHHAIPHADPFSGPNAGKPWAAYSWLFELLVTGMFHRFGLVGLLAYSAGMVLAIALATSSSAFRPTSPSSRCSPSHAASASDTCLRPGPGSSPSCSSSWK
jgi:hypothetical protein